MVEGHKGSLICARCLTLACRALADGSAVMMEDTSSCTTCLMHKREPSWQSPAYPEAWICTWCIEKSAAMLERDPDFAWSRPTPGGAGG